MTRELIVAGLSFGAAFGSLLLIRGLLRRSPVILGTAGLSLISVVAAGLILASQEAPPAAVAWLELTELALTMAAGPFSLIVLGSFLRVSVPATRSVGLGVGGFIAIALVQARYGGDPIVYAVPIHIGFTLWGWQLFLRRKEAGMARKSLQYRQRLLAFWLLVTISIANLASLARLLFSEVHALRTLVPLTISTLFLTLFVGMVWAFLERHTHLLHGRHALSEEDAAMVRAAAALVAREGLFREADLKADMVAQRLGIPVTRLAAALANSEWEGFATMLQRLRIEQVRSMLADPRERTTSIDAIGLLCGFRSRSALYQQFQRQFGMSPGEYRKRADSLS